MPKRTRIQRIAKRIRPHRTLVLAGIALAVALGLTAAVGAFAAPTRHLTVQVNPVGLTPGSVEVEIQPANCSGGSRKTVPAGGVVNFGPCANTNHSAVAHPGAFKKGNQNCTAAVQSAPANNSAQLYYGCVADAAPAPPGGGGSGGGGGGSQKPPDRQPTTMRVWVNPHPALAGTKVAVSGAGCGGSKAVGRDGWADFSGCRIGEGVTVSVPKTINKDEGTYEVPSNQRKFNVSKNETVTFKYELSAAVAYLSKKGCSPKGVEYRNQVKYDTTDARKRQFGKAGENLVGMYFMGERVTVHERVAPCLQAVENELRAHGNKYDVYRVDSYAPIGGHNKPWQYHGYGAALDINPPENPQCPGVDLQNRCGDKKPYKLPDWWVKIFQKYGFWWGGYYQHSAKDYMHFEFHR